MEIHPGETPMLLRAQLRSTPVTMMLPHAKEEQGCLPILHPIIQRHKAPHTAGDAIPTAPL